MVFFQPFQTVDDSCLAAASIGGSAVAVMDGGGAVQTDADEEVIVMQELGPFVIEQGAIRLEDVLDNGRRRLQFVLDLDGLFVEIQPHQRRFAALPGERIFGLRTAEITCNHLAESCFRHAAMPVRIEEAFAGVETILAMEVAVSACGFDEQCEIWKVFGHQLKSVSRTLCECCLTSAWRLLPLASIVTTAGKSFTSNCQMASGAPN